MSGAAFMSHEKQVYYSMAVTDFNSFYAKGAGYFLQIEVMKALKEKGYERYVVGVLAGKGDAPKLRHISNFKKQFGNLYIVEGENFPFKSYTLTGGKAG